MDFLVFDGKDTPLAGIIALFQQLPNVLGLIIILSIYVLLVVAQGILFRQITIRNTEIQHGFFDIYEMKHMS